MEMFNSFMLLVVIYHLMCCTKFVPHLPTREKIGVSYIVIVCFICLVACGVLIIQSLHKKL